MDLQTLLSSGTIIFEARAGSHAFGLNIDTSDEDIRGIFRLPREFYLRISGIPEQVGDERQNTVYYDLRKFIGLAAGCNPNIIELLWTPEEEIRICTPPMRRLLAARQAFITKKAHQTFSGYAAAQIKKARGQNKLVNNPESRQRPSQLDFCWIIPIPYPRDWGYMPGRPIPLKDSGFDLRYYHAAKLEHVPGMYRLYHYGNHAKGVFRGTPEKGLMLVPESIPIDHEWPLFRALLVYNQEEYEHAVRRWENYWTWQKERNAARWVSQERGQVDYDLKNMMHCMRLIFSCESILRHGAPLVRLTGEKRAYLMGIRQGRFPYEQLIGQVEEKLAELDALRESSRIPDDVNREEIDALFVSLLEDA